jgi:uncharacterized protein (UPF0333 family)
LSNIFVIIFNKRGQSLVLLTVSVAVLLLLAGVVLDAGNIFWQYRQLRNYSDAAALAGAVELPQAAAARDSAAEYYSQNIAKGLKAVDAENNTIKYMGSGEDTVYVTSPFRDDRTFRLGVPSNWTIEVRAERIAKTFWLRLIGIRDIPIRVRSVAKGGEAGIQAFWPVVKPVHRVGGILWNSAAVRITSIDLPVPTTILR